jgi:hypothetical protein
MSTVGAVVVELEMVVGKEWGDDEIVLHRFVPLQALVPSILEPRNRGAKDGLGDVIEHSSCDQAATHHFL